MSYCQNTAQYPACAADWFSMKSNLCPSLQLCQPSITSMIIIYLGHTHFLHHATHRVQTPYAPATPASDFMQHDTGHLLKCKRSDASLKGVSQTLQVLGLGRTLHPKPEVCMPCRRAVAGANPEDFLVASPGRDFQPPWDRSGAVQDTFKQLHSTLSSELRRFVDHPSYS